MGGRLSRKGGSDQRTDEVMGRYLREMARPAVSRRLGRSGRNRQLQDVRQPMLTWASSDPESGAGFRARDPTNERAGQQSLSDSGMSQTHIPAIVRRIS
jgi:hypothetical protein